MRKSLYLVLLMIFFVLSGCKPNQKVEVTFQTNGGTPIETVTSITQLRDGMPTTTKVGYTFSGWYTDETLTQAFDPLVDRDTWVFTIYAKWVANETTYTVEHYLETLIAGEYEKIETETLNAAVGQTVNLVAKTYTGFTYQSTHDEALSSGSIPTTGVLVLKAYYQRNTYTITIDEDGGNSVSDLVIKYQAEVVLPSLTRTGFTFLGYDTEITQMGAENMTVKALWEAIPLYTITFDSKGGSAVPSQTVYEDTTLSLPIPPTKLGYQFDGWVKQGGSATYLFTLPVTEAFTLEAKWSPVMVTVQTEIYTEDLNGVFQLHQTITHEALTESLTNASLLDLAGFAENLTHVNRVITGTTLADGSLVLRRYYDRLSFTISFVSNASISIDSITAKFTSPIGEPTDPVRTGYVFNGWFSDEALTAPYVFTNMPAQDITLYAKWTGESMTLYFDSQGGSMVDGIVAPYNTSIDAPANPTKIGYSFSGWYTTTAFDTAFSNWVMPLGNITLYAKWVPETYTITFESNGGSVVNPLEAPYLSDISSPSNPTKTDYIFLGWFMDSNLVEAYTFTIMPLNGLTLYAKWASMDDDLPLSMILTLDPYTQVKVDASVLMLASYPAYGFYVTDGSANMYVYYDQEAVFEGLAYVFDAIIVMADGVKSLSMVENITPSSKVHTYTSKIDHTIDEIHDLPIESEGIWVKTTGILSYINYPAVVDTTTYTSIPLDINYHYFMYENEFTGLVSISGLLHHSSSGWVIRVMTIEVTELSITEMFNYVKTYLDSYYLRDFYSGDSFELIHNDPFGFAYIEYANTPSLDTFYIANLKKLITVELIQTIDLEATIHIDFETDTYIKEITINPHDPLSIEAYLSGLNEVGVVQGLVTLAERDEAIFILYDGENYLYITGNLNANYGDMIQVKVHKYLYNGLNMASYEDEEYLNILSENNELDPAQVKNIDLLVPTDESLYGQFIEVRGFLLNTGDIEFHGTFSISTETTQISVRPVSYAAFENLFGYKGLEVILRGYLAFEDGKLILLYAGERSELSIPDYTDAQRVQMIYTVFSNNYANKQFKAFETFKLMPYHEILGGHITYQFIQGGDYYDVNHEYFKFAYTDQVIQIEMTITIHEVSSTFTFNTTLISPALSTVAEFKMDNTYETMYVEGVVVYRNPWFAYLQDETGILMIEGNDLPMYIGDHIVVRGSVSKAYPEYINTTLYYDRRDDHDIPLVVYQIERDLTTKMDLRPITWTLLKSWYSYTPEAYHQYIELTGYLTASGDEYYLAFGPDKITFYAVDEYSQNKLIPHLNTYVSIALVITGHDGYEFEYLFLGNEDSTEEVTYTHQEKVDMVKSWIDLLWSEPIKSNQNLPSMPYPAGITITYAMASGDEAYIDFLFNFVPAVIEDTEVNVIATFTVDDVEYTYPLYVLIKASSATVDVLSIFEAKQILGEEIKVSGILKTHFRFNMNEYASLLCDDSGCLIVKYPSDYYIYGNTYIGYETTFTGVMTKSEGRYVFEISQMTYSYTDAGFQEFTSIPIEVLYAFSQGNDDYLGDPVEVEGILERVNYEYYQITRNGISIRIQSLYDTEYSLEPFIGFNVRIKGFMLGRTTYNDDQIAILVNMYPYSLDESNINLAGGSYEEIVNQLADNLINARYDEPYYPGDYIYLTTSTAVLPEAVISYTILNDEFVLEDHGTYFIVLGAYFDTYIDIQLMVTYEYEEVIRIFTIKVLGMIPNNFEDLFDETVPFDEITLLATVIYESFDFSYYEIEGQIYYYNGYLGGYQDEGALVIIHGKKSTIDGVTNYSYNVTSLPYFDSSEPIYQTTSKSIEEIYQIDLSVEDIRTKAISVFGKLGYDRYLNYFTLTNDLGQTIYIRHHLEDEHEYKMGGGEVSQTFLHAYLGDYIYISLFYPNITTLYDQVLMDFLGDENDVVLPEWTLSERFDIVSEKIKANFDGKSFDGGVYLNLPDYDQIHGIQLSYEKTNPTDLGVYLDNYRYFTQMVEVETTINITTTMSIYNMMTETYDTATFTFDIVVKPRLLSSIHEVLNGITGDMYVIEGVIEAIDPETFMLIKDASGRIYVETSSNITLPTLEVGDLVRILGNRNLYDYEDYIPVIDDIYDIKIISSDNAVTNIYTHMDMADILAINYLDPDQFTKPVTLTGTVVFTGNQWYPSYDLRIDDTYGTTYTIYMFGQDYDAFNALMGPRVGQTITVEGYLIGFTYIYDLFDWKVCVINSTVIS